MRCAAAPAAASPAPWHAAPRCLPPPPPVGPGCKLVWFPIWRMPHCQDLGAALCGLAADGHSSDRCRPCFRRLQDSWSCLSSHQGHKVPLAGLLHRREASCGARPPGDASTAGRRRGARHRQRVPGVLPTPCLCRCRAAARGCPPVHESCRPSRGTPWWQQSSSCKQHGATPLAVLSARATRNEPHLTRCNVKSSSTGAAAASAAALAVSCAVRRSASCPAAFSSSAPCSARSSRRLGQVWFLCYWLHGRQGGRAAEPVDGGKGFEGFRVY